MEKNFSYLFKRKKNLILLISIIFLVSTNLIIANCETSELSLNSSFESFSSDTPTNWDKYSYMNSKEISIFKKETSNSHSGKFCVSIENVKENDARYEQTVKVEKGKSYKLSGYIRTVNIPNDTKKIGACLSFDNKLDTTQPIIGTSTDWKYVELYATIGDGVESIKITAGLGGYGSMNTGKAYFDDLSFVMVDNIPSNALVSKIGETTNPIQQQSQPPTQESNNQGIYLFIIFVLFIIAGVFAFLYFKEKYSIKFESSQNKDNEEVGNEELNNIEAPNNEEQNVAQQDNDETLELKNVLNSSLTTDESENDVSSETNN